MKSLLFGQARAVRVSRSCCFQRSPQLGLQRGLLSLCAAAAFEKVNQLVLDRPDPRRLVFGYMDALELQRAIKIALKHLWMNVTLAAHGGGVPELLRDILYYPQGSGLGRLHLFQFIQREDRKIGPGPRAKIFGSYV